MATTFKVFLLIVSTLFPIVDPISGAPLFLALTPDYTTGTRRALAWRVSIDCFWILLASYFIGAKVLAFFGVSLPVVQVGGGLMLTAIGWSMLGDKPAGTQKSVPSSDPFSRAFYPLAMPLTVGPGSIAVAITLGANNAHRYGLHVLIIVVSILGLAAIGASVYLCYAFANRLVPKLGAAGMAIMVRLSSFLLICIGVQITWNGVSALLTSLVFHVQ